MNGYVVMGILAVLLILGWKYCPKETETLEEKLFRANRSAR